MLLRAVAGAAVPLLAWLAGGDGARRGVGGGGRRPARGEAGAADVSDDERPVVSAPHSHADRVLQEEHGEDGEERAAGDAGAGSDSPGEYGRDDDSRGEEFDFTVACLWNKQESIGSKRGSCGRRSS